MEANARYVIRRSTPKEATALVERLVPQFPLGFIEERQMTVRQGAEDPMLVVIDSECQYLDLLGLDFPSWKTPDCCTPARTTEKTCP